MEPQTESNTPATPDTDLSCFEKARANGESTFTLRAQDITAPLVVDFWIAVQDKMKAFLSTGLSLEAAEKATRAYYFLDRPVVNTDRKLTQACALAGAMGKWPNRRLAD